MGCPSRREALVLLFERHYAELANAELGRSDDARSGLRAPLLDTGAPPLNTRWLKPARRRRGARSTGP